MQTSIKVNTKKLESQIAEIETIATNKNWHFAYDADLDSLSLSPKQISPEFSLFSLNNEFSMYIDKDSNLGGLFIEYYKTNLTTHDVKFKRFKDLFNNKDNTIYLKNRHKEDAILLSEVLKAELLSQLIKKDSISFSIPA